MKSRDGKATWQKTEWGNYRVRFHCVDGERRNKICKTKTDRDALINAIRRRENLDYWFPDEGSNVASHEVGTFKALAEKWLDYCKTVREISESCLMNYRCHLKHHILPILGARFLNDLDLKAIEEVASALKNKRPQTRSYRAVRQNRMDQEFFENDDFLSAAYRREILTVGCMVTKFGFERGYLSVNPFKEFKLPECPEQPYDYWRLDDEDAFFQWLENGGYVEKEVCKPHSKRKGKPETFLKRFRTRGVEGLYDVVLFALRSGLRKGEIGALTARDVNFAKNCVVVRRSYSEKEKVLKQTTKGKTFRIIEMNIDMREILQKRVARVKSETEPLFDTRTWAIKNFSKYCAKAGVREIHFHSLRHTCLTNLANGYGMSAPLPLPQVQKIAGHKDIGTTMRYVHADGIENTASRQWSREQRRALRDVQPGASDGPPVREASVSVPLPAAPSLPVEAQKPSVVVVRRSHLRVVNS